MNLIKYLIFSLACVWVLPSFSQWQWVDKDGRKVFSDRAPPSDVPDKNILKQPNPRGKVVEAAAPVPSSSASTAQQVQGGTAKPSGVDKELMEKKKQAADAEVAKRKAEEERVARAQAESCARARQAKAGLDAGQRVSRTNANGEREFLDGDNRAAETQRLQSVIDADCK
jgi:hypothetical protein